MSSSKGLFRSKLLRLPRNSIYRLLRIYGSKTDLQIGEGTLDNFVDVLFGEVQRVKHAIGWQKLGNGVDTSTASDLVNCRGGAGARCPGDVGTQPNRARLLQGSWPASG